MSEWIGKIVVCDRCGRECRRKLLNCEDLDGGFAHHLRFTEMPATWKYQKGGEDQDGTMTAKEYLKQYEYAHRKAMRCRKEYENEMQCIDAVRSVSDNDGMPHGSGISKPTEQKAIRLANTALKWKTAELEALETKQRIFTVINTVPGIEGDVLFGKYIELRKWEEIADALHFSVQHVYRIHGRALQIVSEKMRVNESNDPAIMIASEGRPEDRTT